MGEHRCDRAYLADPGLHRCEELIQRDRGKVNEGRDVSHRPRAPINQSGVDQPHRHPNLVTLQGRSCSLSSKDGLVADEEVSAHVNPPNESNRTAALHH
ncbi:hypothetical protein ACGFI4_20060 [Micromonospora carbonacea]|uniref:hypothetical protein n=1 Tax=Micromonospora TaxID=1873 RepID=UPI00371568C1